MWHIVRTGDKFLFDGEILRDFFVKWYEKNVDMEELEEEEARTLALPCFVFDYVQGFAEITKWLVYNYPGHIKEKRPVHFNWEHQHLAPPDFVGPINAVRGRLKSLIHRGMWDGIGDLLKRRSCSCGRWETTAGRYFAELVRTEAFPLEDTYAKSSANDILGRLKYFRMIPTSSSCPHCSRKWEIPIKEAIEKTQYYFNGLCIDCMDRSMAKRESSDVDYWKHNEPMEGRWDKHCRIKHGEPTWYASWRGRDETRQKLIKEHRKEKRARDDS
ncbi:hypothetical protein BDV96DRAFT_484412 [Lophiotrema nucula]|uniref:Uncharacterized protein n=1 Tax=Lophiotrema nucula TaxID=690887 RepID=A0A6A5ZPZ8_9PLEO|nr:hypothetical protein BDV96DRAFT_484412 [Lophiotrema nucula]